MNVPVSVRDVVERTPGVPADLWWSRSPGPQRHRSWCGSLPRGPSVWLKVGTDETSVAGVIREGVVLSALGGRGGVPRLLATGAGPPPFLVTEHRPGTMLVDLPDDRVAASLGALADALARFHRMARVPAHPPGAVGERDLFGADPDPVALLGPDGAAAWPDLRPGRTGRRLAVGSVHGSFDARNVLIDADGRVSLLDLEAARPGPLEIDVAAMACDLLLVRGRTLADRWLGLWGTAGRVAHRGDIAAFMALRLWYRSQGVGVDDATVGAATGIIEDLTAVRGAPSGSGPS